MSNKRYYVVYKDYKKAQSGVQKTMTTDIRIISEARGSRVKVYEMTPEQAEQLKNDPDISSVTDSTITPTPENDWITSSNYFWRGEHVSFAGDVPSNRRNWALYRCIAGENPPPQSGDLLRQRWGFSSRDLYTNLPQEGVYRAYTGKSAITLNTQSDGEHVDIVLLEGGHVNHTMPEFAVNPDGTGGSRVVLYNWAQHWNDINPSVPNGQTNYGSEFFSTHATATASCAAGNTQGFARKANIYTLSLSDCPAEVSPNAINLVREFHKKKPINPATGRKNPTVVNNSWSYRWPLYEGVNPPITWELTERRDENGLVPEGQRVTGPLWQPAAVLMGGLTSFQIGTNDAVVGKELQTLEESSIISTKTQVGVNSPLPDYKKYIIDTSNYRSNPAFNTLQWTANSAASSEWSNSGSNNIINSGTMKVHNPNASPELTITVPPEQGTVVLNISLEYQFKDIVTTTPLSGTLKGQWSIWKIEGSTETQIKSYETNTVSLTSWGGGGAWTWVGMDQSVSVRLNGAGQYKFKYKTIVQSDTTFNSNSTSGLTYRSVIKYDFADKITVEESDISKSDFNDLTTGMTPLPTGGDYEGHIVNLSGITGRTFWPTLYGVNLKGFHSLPNRKLPGLLWRDVTNEYPTPPSTPMIAFTHFDKVVWDFQWGTSLGPYYNRRYKVVDTPNGQELRLLISYGALSGGSLLRRTWAPQGLDQSMELLYIFKQNEPNKVTILVGKNNYGGLPDNFVHPDWWKRMGTTLVQSIISGSVPAYVDWVNADYDDAIDEGIITIGSAGNNYHYMLKHDDPVKELRSETRLYPEDNSPVTFKYNDLQSPGSAGGDNSLCIGAVSAHWPDKIAHFTRRGPGVDLYAPGELIMAQSYDTGVQLPTRDPRNNSASFDYATGTSFSSPLVAGVAAMVLEYYPYFSQKEIKEYLIDMSGKDQVNEEVIEKEWDDPYTGVEDYGYWAVHALREGSNNRYLRFNNIRPINGQTYPAVKRNIRPSTGVLFPRPKICKK